MEGYILLNIAYIGNGKSTNRYHAPFAKKVKIFESKQSIHHLGKFDGKN